MKSEVMRYLAILLVLGGASACGSNDSGGGSGGGSGAGGSGSGGSGGANPGAPVVNIISPTEGSMLKSSDAITVKGTAIDPQEGTLTDPARVLWFSDQKPDPIGEGPEDPLQPNEMPIGTKIIKLTATDLDGNTGSDQVNVTVQ